jgi:hypothetical protein
MLFIFLIFFKKKICFSLFLAFFVVVFFPSLNALFWFLVLNFMNIQIHIGSCKMITDLFLHTVRFLSSYYCMSEMNVMSLVFHVGFGCSYAGRAQL